MSESGWTVDTLREHIDQRFLDSQREIAAALAAVKQENKTVAEASEKAIIKAEAKQDSYNASHNDLIRKAERLAELTMPREEIENRIVAAREHADDQHKVAMEKIEEIRRILSGNQGSGMGKREFWGYVVGAVTLAVLLWKAFGHP